MSLIRGKSEYCIKQMYNDYQNVCKHHSDKQQRFVNKFEKEFDMIQTYFNSHKIEIEAVIKTDLEYFYKALNYNDVKAFQTEIEELDTKIPLFSDYCLSYISTKRAIQKAKSKELDNKIKELPFKVYKRIIEHYNYNRLHKKMLTDFILTLGKGLGSILISRRFTNSMKPDWNEFMRIKRETGVGKVIPTKDKIGYLMTWRRTFSNKQSVIYHFKPYKARFNAWISKDKTETKSYQAPDFRFYRLDEYAKDTDYDTILKAKLPLLIKLIITHKFNPDKLPIQ